MFQVKCFCTQQVGLIGKRLAAADLKECPLKYTCSSCQAKHWCPQDWKGTDCSRGMSTEKICCSNKGNFYRSLKGVAFTRPTEALPLIGLYFHAGSDGLSSWVRACDKRTSIREKPVCKPCLLRSFKSLKGASAEFSDVPVTKAPWLSAGIMQRSPIMTDVGAITVWKTPLPFTEKLEGVNVIRECDFSVAKLVCSKTQSLKIKSSRYGRMQGKHPALKYLCGGVSIELLNLNTCAESKPVELSHCNGLQMCSVPVSKQLLSGVDAPCKSGSNYIEVHYLCVNDPPKPPPHGFEQKPFGANLQKVVKQFKRPSGLPLWAQRFAAPAANAVVVLPPPAVLNPNIKDAETDNCKSIGEVHMMDADGQTRCFPPKQGEITPCFHKVSGENKLINICGKQRIVKCTRSRLSERCGALIDGQTGSVVHIRKGTHATVQFEANYVFTQVNIYFIPDDKTRTQKANRFTASVQCLDPAQGAWRTVGTVTKLIPEGLESGWSIVTLRRCASATWRLAHVNPTESSQQEVGISELDFSGPRVGVVHALPPIDNDPCGFAMSIQSEGKPAMRPVITTTWPSHKQKCLDKSAGSKQKPQHQVANRWMHAVTTCLIACLLPSRL